MPYQSDSPLCTPPTVEDYGKDLIKLINVYSSKLTDIRNLIIPATSHFAIEDFKSFLKDTICISCKTLSMVIIEVIIEKRSYWNKKS